ncbi:MAG: nitroreductase family protein, partial [Oscillospiraceae bacterium]
TMLQSMQKGLQKEQTSNSILPESKTLLAGAFHTLKIMEQAPVTIFIVNSLGKNLFDPLNTEDRIYEICNMQSIGAAIQNMTLAATELGLGSLWICDIFFAYKELSDWLNVDGELVAAMAVGYADEQPAARPRKPLSEIVEWRS